MAILQIDPMSLQDIEAVVLRRWERLEIGDIDYYKTVEKSFSSSSEAIAVRIDGELCLLFGHGARSLFAGSGFAWMLVTEKAEEHWITLAKLSKRVVGKLNEIYPEVFTATYPGNSRSIHWLKWLGFREYARTENNLTMVRG